MEPNFNQDLKQLTRSLQEVVENEREAVLALVIRSLGSAPGKVGAKMLIFPDGSIEGTVGGGVVEARVIADSLNALEDGKGPRTINYNLSELGMSCGGEMGVYLEPVLPPKRIIIFGGGHVGAAVARVMASLGCRIKVVDDRPEWANRERFPQAEEIINLPFAEAVSKYPPGPRDHVLIMTRGHEHDQLILEAVADKDAAWVGMIGSKKKAAQALQKLQDNGVPKEKILKVRCPVGLDIGAITPEEIAISIAAELILLWRSGKMRSGSQPPPVPGRNNRPEAKNEGVVKKSSEEK